MKRRETPQRTGALVALAPWAARSVTTGAEIQVFNGRACGCCAVWIGDLQEADCGVALVGVHNAAVERRRLGMPDRYGSCHTATVGGCVIEGQVPAADIKRLLDTPLQVLGLAVPGMHASAPGMEVPGRHQPCQVLLVDAVGQATLFASHRG